MKPNYLKLKEFLKEELKEKFKSGDIFYSQNYLMKKFKLSYATVTRALNELEREGYIYRIQGKGTFVADLIEREVSFSREIKNIGIVFRNISFLTHPYIKKIIEGIENTGYKNNYHFFFYPLGGRSITSENGSLFFKSVENKELNGVIMLDFINRRDLNFLIEKNIPIVCVGHYYKGVNIPSIFLNEDYIGEKITEKLILKGNKRIGVITGPISQAISYGAVSSSLLFLDGYKNALKRYEIEYDENLIKESDFEKEKVLNLINELFSLEEPPTAIILIDEAMSVEMKNLIGKDVIVKTLKFSEIGEEVGRKTLEILEKVMKKEEILNERIIVPFKMEEI
ncbi:MAG: LacI family transcriptional regulator [Candidatus Omnitrophica bacterium]|nr:LacI family transcriptional regulator [Candidatus Omnitrophota bacterium]